MPVSTSDPKRKPEKQVETVLERFLLDQAIITPETSDLVVLAAVSGGVDSMALLAALNRLSGRYEHFKVYAAHLIHHPEEPQALHRAALVRRYCTERSIPLTVEELTSNPGAGQSPEEWMRQERYRFLETTAQQEGCSWVLTAHHSDDQAETILHRVVTGTGLRGLTGIRPRRGNVLRPFLKVSKGDLRAYCQAEAIPFAEDPTNYDMSRPRNRIRRDILPLLERELNPEARAALNRLGCWAAEAGDLVDFQVNQCLKEAVRIFQKGEIALDIDAILPYFNVIRKNTLRVAINRVAGAEVPLQGKDFDRLEVLISNGRTGSYLKFPGNIRVFKNRRQLIITAGGQESFHYRLVTGQNLVFPELNLKAFWESAPLPPFRLGDDESADMELPLNSGELVLRNAQEGDHFFPLGAPGPKRLFRFLTDRKVSRLEKPRTLVLEHKDEIIWVIKHRISQQVRVTGMNKAVWRLSLIPLEPARESSRGE
jgi:tRNA(Ile)-lysidine synthase